MSLLLIELGVIILGLGVLARLATRLGLSAIPLYLLAGLAFGNGGLLPLQLSEDFVHLGAEIGVILLLFMLGLDHSADEPATSLRSGMPSGIADLLLNFPPVSWPRSSLAGVPWRLSCWVVLPTYLHQE